MNLSMPHGEERRAATRLEPWAQGASVAVTAAPILPDAALRAAPQDEGGDNRHVGALA